MDTQKMIVFDIDGTLLDSNKKVLPSTIAALKSLKKAGHHLFLATGRSLLYTQSIIKHLGFENYILCNGAIGFYQHQQIISKPLDATEIQKFYQKSLELQLDMAIITLNDLTRLTSFDFTKMQAGMELVGAPVPPLYSNQLNQEEVYQGLAFFEPQFDREFENEFKKFNFIRWHENSVDVVADKLSKATTILEIASQLAVSREDIIAFGDGLNDKEMLMHSGIGVAMGNADAEIQKIADLVTSNNDQDGIFHALRKLQLI
ncbi:Cof subfamily protein (haloacid dehalogenase superfamily) [Enterococcus sp. PF1-24]|uniref:HAD family hydrolase n=1 Tax=unclassified Enterococcus TaxID=2608891 RepID=UPI0024765201|nr:MULTISPECIES: HAD family hydrolase [unclassified Enterococcus]MDH6364981.1 Cof subfamily protein (haloacid dehalogenase superfamily) [Enterococcus sp. PFB1-1]MDH6402082.1 Cof subfamily protein (haloacid dehalogenase superfamily) [Enterococcus sp. PF1-24]